MAAVLKPASIAEALVFRVGGEEYAAAARQHGRLLVHQRHRHAEPRMTLVLDMDRYLAGDMPALEEAA